MLFIQVDSCPRYGETRNAGRISAPASLALREATAVKSFKKFSMGSLYLDLGASSCQYSKFLSLFKDKYSQ